jgi:hypothetical protein
MRRIPAQSFGQGTTKDSHKTLWKLYQIQQIRCPSLSQAWTAKKNTQAWRSLKTSMLQRQQPVQLPQAYPQHRFRCLRASEKLGKEFWATPQKRSQKTFDNRANQYNQRGDTSSGGWGRGQLDEGLILLQDLVHSSNKQHNYKHIVKWHYIVWTNNVIYLDINNV